LQKSLKLEDARVAWVVPSLGSGGGLLYHKPLLKNLASHCASFRVFTAELFGEKNDAEIEIENCGMIKRFYFEITQADLWNDNHGREIRIIPPTLIPALLKYRPDLLVVTEFSLWSLYAMISRYLMSAVRVLVLVETKPRFDQSNLIWHIRNAMRNFIVKKADMFLTNNQDGARYLISKFHAPSSRVIVRPFLVSDMAEISGKTKEDILAHRKSRGSVLPVRFLYVGRLLELKGLQYAIAALASLIPQYHRGFVFDIVGDGPFRENLEIKVQRLGLTKHVIFHGRLPYSTLWQWYFQADVFLFPTLSDYRALSPFEALSMGLPLVSSIHDGGVHETVDSDRNGFFCDPRDTPDLARIIARFIDSPALIAEFSERSLDMSSPYTLQSGAESLSYACQSTLDSPA